ncbi:hypothetical protein MJO29_013631 [Puccinia striiformis f. sp. tritici]|uniref:DUF7872 domain-containing protein n=1 Tax=Puccinia striiformis f. sp. tritici PST-78 TaxID=1165861 RepID=A0A0L0UWJ6_9BASI|nr:hypothetical protein Pst134EA_025620 [Puccinia striiformis f. sp. tritici]KAI9613149.1 hypothetical protein H4Q26_010428 [Puccinia striiformis f. sp. tritici PST-130]KNE91104.1 hypothetical protein PSTG_15456 [Puccinia striiformis f. sp. tritici PST-78]KAH9451676.1 hypothetical protein Pst134EA_025620 [Puccinia striiformis f. sp. tritici]KAI7941557.1 hypothetical protein MJO29_013631 [Puccinia striiformis f. sp. tritici]KNE91105.1 hypothetical protein, variant [Puccinia striiformis f. sp. t
MLSNFVLSFSILVVLFASLTLVESGTYGGTQVTLPIREKKLPPIVTTDTTGTTNATGTTGTNSTTSALALTNTSKICDVESPTPEVWKARNISGFLSSYPNGNNLTLAQFAEQHGVYNFKCGIGDTCDAGQICAPIPGPVWHVLYAVQQWHHIQESLNRALAFAANTLIVTGSQISTDLFPPDKEKSDHLYKVSFILALVVAIIATISAAAFLWVPGVNNILIMGAIGAVGAAVATGQAVTTIQAQQAFDSMKSDAFSRWAGYTEAITKWQEGMQKQLFDDTKRALGLGINDPAGLGGVLANGALFTNTLQKTTYDIEKTLEDVVKRRLINGILREKKAFVTVNSDECKQGGPNGAFKSEDGWLSWCKDGKMMNIIYADGNKSGNKLYNGGMIPAKYGITVEYMTTQSENCQIKYGGYGHDPYGDGKLPTDINADCIFNLPVCWPSADKSIRKKRRKHGTVVACRDNAALPI